MWSASDLPPFHIFLLFCRVSAWRLMELSVVCGINPTCVWENEGQVLKPETLREVTKSHFWAWWDARRSSVSHKILDFKKELRSCVSTWSCLASYCLTHKRVETVFHFPLTLTVHEGKAGRSFGCKTEGRNRCSWVLSLNFNDPEFVNSLLKMCILAPTCSDTSVVCLFVCCFVVLGRGTNVCWSWENSPFSPPVTDHLKMTWEGLEI